jgi:hypothetical protein
MPTYLLMAIRPADDALIINLLLKLKDHVPVAAGCLVSIHNPGYLSVIWICIFRASIATEERLSTKNT